MTHRGPDYWDERYRQKDFVWTADPNRFLVGAVEGLEPGSALDLACGEGRNAVWLASLGWEVDAVDFSGVAVGKARDLAGRLDVEVDFTVRDLLVWEPPEASYDLVIVVYLQIPAPGREQVWSSAAGAVRPGGTLVVIGHDSDNLTLGCGGPQDPAVLYQVDDVVSAVGDDLEVVRSEQVIRPVEDETGHHEAIDNIVVAARR